MAAVFYEKAANFCVVKLHKNKCVSFVKNINRLELVQKMY